MNSTEKLANSKPDRKQRKINLLPWLVFLLVMFCLVVMNIRGIPDPDSVTTVFDPKTRSFEQMCCYEHGWPWKWLRSHPTVTPPGVVISAPAANNVRGTNVRGSAWLLSVTGTEHRLESFVWNILVAALILAAVFAASRYRLGKQRRFRFSLLELGICMLLASVVFANFQHHRSIANREREPLPLSREKVQLLDTRWCGPEWLRSLFGEQEWMSNYWHAGKLEFNLINVKDDLTESFARFPYLRELKILGDPNRSQIESLSQLNLEKISFTGQSNYFLSTDSFKKGFGFYEDTQLLIRRRRESQNNDYGESRDLRIQKVSIQLPHVVELKIDSTVDSKNRWPRALDLVNCCPNLEKVSLRGRQYLSEDLWGLPSTIREIEIGIFLSANEIDDLKKRFPKSVITQVKTNRNENAEWVIAENRVNRRRKTGWDDSQFRFSILDLSLTETDQAFLKRLRPIFPDVKTVFFGSFDSPATAIWLVQQFPQLKRVNAGDFRFEFADVMKLPERIQILDMEQGSITAEEVLILIQHLKLRKLILRSATLEQSQKKTIQSATPSCSIEFR